ncbi:hypothetical protein [Acidovorax sp.]|uniref:hypothetical protein n=1 Tax=Acidovorax sp. TaxID=1872122 RepID=UPI00391F3316
MSPSFAPTLQTPAMDRSVHERRSGTDRRQREDGPPGKHERRRSIEHRQPEVRELYLSHEEMLALGFGRAPSPAVQQRPG